VAAFDPIADVGSACEAAVMMDDGEGRSDKRVRKIAEQKPVEKPQ
jgi:hypothetical protein